MYCTSGFVHLEKFSLVNFSNLSFAICVNLLHPCSLLVYSCLFGFSLPWQTIIERFLSSKGQFSTTQKTTQNIMMYMYSSFFKSVMFVHVGDF